MLIYSLDVMNHLKIGLLDVKKLDIHICSMVQLSLTWRTMIIYAASVFNICGSFQLIHHIKQCLYVQYAEQGFVCNNMQFQGALPRRCLLRNFSTLGQNQRLQFFLLRARVERRRGEINQIHQIEPIWGQEHPPLVVSHLLYLFYLSVIFASPRGFSHESQHQQRNGL